MSQSPAVSSSVRPLGWERSLLFFGIPALLLVLANYVATPVLISLGILSFYAQMIPGTILNALLLAAALYGYRAEGRPLTWAGLKERFRLSPIKGKMWLLVIVAALLRFFVYQPASTIDHLLIEKGWMPLPASLPAWLDPRVSLPLVERFNREAGGLQGNWPVFLMAFITFFFNIVGEESWWRGYILPRQELVFGKWVWLVHGLMWCFFHVFKWWDLIGLLPGCLLLSYVVWRFKNNSYGYVLHITSNIAFPLYILLGVLGIVM